MHIVSLSEKVISNSRTSFSLESGLMSDPSMVILWRAYLLRTKLVSLPPDESFCYGVKGLAQWYIFAPLLGFLPSLGLGLPKASCLSKIDLSSIWVALPLILFQVGILGETLYLLLELVTFFCVVPIKLLNLHHLLGSYPMMSDWGDYTRGMSCV